jgi:hypothetical protein
MSCLYLWSSKRIFAPLAMREADHVDLDQKYVRQLEDLSRKEAQDMSLTHASFGSLFGATIKDRDVESLTSNGRSGTEKSAFLNDCREASSGYNSSSSDSSKWAWRDVGVHLAIPIVEGVT